jgi:hypothetical protein
MLGLQKMSLTLSMQNHTVVYLTMVYEQAAAFGLSSVVYVPKIELGTVAELSAFCEKASTVNLSSKHYF